MRTQWLQLAATVIRVPQSTSASRTPHATVKQRPPPCGLNASPHTTSPLKMLLAAFCESVQVVSSHKQAFCSYENYSAVPRAISCLAMPCKNNTSYDGIAATKKLQEQGILKPSRIDGTIGNILTSKLHMRAPNPRTACT